MVHGKISAEALMSLVDASQAINMATDLDDSLEAIARSAVSVMACEGASLILPDSTGSRQIFRVVIGDKAESLRGMEMAIDQGISGLCMKTRRAYIVNEAARNSHHFRGIDQRIDFSTQNIIAAPLNMQDETLGVLEVVNTLDGHPFNEGDLEVCRIFANLAASALSKARLLDELRRENTGFKRQQPRLEMIGQSPAMRQIRELIERVAPTDSTVFILGETGTGKEITALEIKRLSRRSDGPFIAVNCAALPESLLESELFGHEAGAFTGAVKARAGRFELADGGTIFLDEVTEMTLDAQARLLRVLQEREVQRIGASKPVRCNVRVIAAANRDLAQAVAQGRFREDLYYRLNVFPIYLPPLRNRIDDIPLLVNFFMKKLSADLNMANPSVTPAAMKILQTYHYPGNIRELQNVIERAMLLAGPSGDAEIHSHHLPKEILENVGGIAAERTPRVEPQADVLGRLYDSPPKISKLAENEKMLILQALDESGWNQSSAARRLGISRDNLRYRLKKYGIKRE